MAGIVDFKCTYDNASGFGEWAAKEYGISFPQAYLEREMMMKLALAGKEHNGTFFCQLPFCHTLEAEALGGKIRFGDGVNGPRTCGYRFETVEEILDLPDLTQSGFGDCGDIPPQMEKTVSDRNRTARLLETFEACKLLHEMGEPVLFLVSGPMTILNGLVNSEVLFRALLKEPELMHKVFEKLGRSILAVMKKAEAAGADVISYADPAGGVNIVGPKVAACIAKEFTVGFLKAIDQELARETLVLLCPKTALALVGSEQAVWKDWQLPDVMEYAEAVLYMKEKMEGRIRFAGQDCVNHAGHRLVDRTFKELILA